jgi:diguanylate cyclase (GGDEF)-like protein
MRNVRALRLLFLLAGGAAVCASFMAVAVGVAPDSNIGPLKLAGIALPGIVTGAFMVAYISWETRNVKAAEVEAAEAKAQLVRKEIEIGRLSTVDELTGLATRREFDEDIRLEFTRFKRHGRQLSMLLVEIDDIQELGEHVGSLSKGYLLSELSNVVRHQLRASDIGGRYGPETLALLLPETGEEQAKVVADKVRAAVTAHSFLGQIGGERVRLTVSQGVAVATADIASAEDFGRAAETALYEARSGGFDQIAVRRDAPPRPDASIRKAS